MVAVILLSSTLTGLFAPAAVAMSEDKIAAAAHTSGLSSKVKDFFEDVLEDAMTRSAAVAQITLTTSKNVVARGRVIFVLPSSSNFRAEHLFARSVPFEDVPSANSLFSSRIARTSGLQPLGP
jgi:hypothetical protein